MEVKEGRVQILLRIDSHGQWERKLMIIFLMRATNIMGLGVIRGKRI